MEGEAGGVHQEVDDFSTHCEITLIVNFFCIKEAEVVAEGDSSSVTWAHLIEFLVCMLRSHPRITCSPYE